MKTFLEEIQRDIPSRFIRFQKRSENLVRFAFPVGPPFQSLGPSLTEENDGDGWFVAQGFAVPNSSFDNKLHLAEDWNAENGDDLGLAVHAAAKGTTVYAEDLGLARGWGGFIIIRHDATPGSHFSLPNGEATTTVWSAYAHLDGSKIREWVDTGPRKEIEHGDQIGVIGPTPSGSSNPHLHFEIRTVIPEPAYPPGHGGASDSVGGNGGQ